MAITFHITISLHGVNVKPSPGLGHLRVVGLASQQHHGSGTKKTWELILYEFFVALVTLTIVTGNG